LDIVKIIEQDKKNKQGKYIGRAYYNYKQTNNDRYVDVVSKGEIKTVDTGGNTSLYTNFFRLLVDQKVEYLLAKEVSSDVENVTDMFIDGLYNASLDSQAWLYFYILDNKLQSAFINDSEIIPIYTNFGKDLSTIIRYYDKDENTIAVEIWTDDNLAKMEIKNTNGKGKIVNAYETSHYSTQTRYDGEVEQETERYFNQIPFIPLYNNRSIETDLVPVKELLDIYNQINSGFISNINDFQEALVKLTGFSANQEVLEETMRNMKEYKVVGLPADGDVEYLKVEIPVAPRELILRLVKENIFLLGKGVEPKTGDGSITNIVIKSRYASLDMKCNGAEKELKKFYHKVVDFINDYESTGYDYEITFNRSIIINESESIEDCVESLKLVDAGAISLQTVIEHNPWVESATDELKQIKKEQSEKVDEIDITTFGDTEKKVL